MRRLTLFASIALLAVAACAQGQGYGMGPGMMGWGCGSGWPWPIMMFVFWIVVIVGVVFLVRWLVLSASKGRGPSQEESSLDILKKRYAKGEINKDEYEKIKKDIS
jgi:putative membrane protein